MAVVMCAWKFSLWKDSSKAILNDEFVNVFIKLYLKQIKLSTYL